MHEKYKLGELNIHAFALLRAVEWIGLMAVRTWCAVRVWVGLAAVRGIEARIGGSKPPRRGGRDEGRGRGTRRGDRDLTRHQVGWSRQDEQWQFSATVFSAFTSLAHRI